MDYLRNLGSVAVSTLVQKSGINLPFTLGQKVASLETLWVLHDATKRDDGSPVSVFEYDFLHPLNKSTIPLAKNALRKLRTIRHPDVLKFMDVVESENAILIMTERVRPLSSALQMCGDKRPQEKQDWLLWGLHRISVALAFINDSVASTHGCVRPNAIFISPSGEWKLGGFEVLSNPKDENPVLYTMGGLLPGSMHCAPPEVKKGGWSTLKDGPISAADSYALGLLLHAVFNPAHPDPETAEPPHPPPQPSSRGSIPLSVFPSFKKLLMPNPRARMTPKMFLDVGMAETAGDISGFFSSNRLVKVCGGLDNFSLGSESDKAMLLRTLKESVTSFPPEFASFRILPSLVNALEFGGASAATILPLVLQFGKNVSPDEYINVVLGPLVRLFVSPDRGTRMALLDNLSEYADKLDKKVVVDKVWPHLQSGFTDTVPVIREATVRAIVLLSPKLSDRILNNDLLRHLARLQSDPEASIRTNTCILIGRLGPTLGYNTKQKVLVPAFSKALKDPFVHARVAGVMAFMATEECFGVEDVAAKVIPTIASATLDKDKIVRDQAFKAMEQFIKRLEVHAASLPETETIEGEAQPLALPGGFTQASLVNSATGAAGAFAGWAMSSLGKKLAPSDLQSAIAGTSTPPIRPNLGAGVNGVNIEGQTPAPASTTPSLGHTRALQLGGHKPSARAVTAQLAEQVVAAEGARANAWGCDLMDVHADEGDWSAFESAPISSKRASVIDLGFDVSSRPGSPKAEDDWGTMGTLASPSSSSLWPSSSPRPPSRALTPQPRVSGSRPALSRVSSPTPPTPVDSELSLKSSGGMSKEEKALEMARRKEERRLRIEKLKEQKEQKKSGSATR